MKSNSRNNQYDNKYIIDFDKAISLIKSYFKSHLQYFEFIEEYNESAGYWGIKYGNNNKTITISCDRGGLDTVIIENGKEIHLSEFDHSMKNVEVASEKNILFTLEVIRNSF